MSAEHELPPAVIEAALAHARARIAYAADDLSDAEHTADLARERNEAADRLTDAIVDASLRASGGAR